VKPAVPHYRRVCYLLVDKMPESSDLLTIRSLVEDIASHDTLDALENSKVTVDDLLFSRGTGFVAMLRSIRGATPSNHSITSCEIETLRLHAAQKLSGRSTPAQHELTSMQQQLSAQGPPSLLSGVSAIDDLLNGSGFPSFTLLEISGPKFSGKTVSALTN
jgi:hypothetical protein